MIGCDNSCLIACCAGDPFPFFILVEKDITIPANENSPPALRLIVLQSASLVFFCYLGLGLEAAVVPDFVHLQLGLSTAFAGVALGAQALATLVCRGVAGKLTDRFGAQGTIVRGLLLLLVSGILFSAAASWARSPQIAFGVLTFSRILLGCGISLVSAAGAVWGIGHAGESNASGVLVWNGVAVSTALTVGAPLGLWLSAIAGPRSVGVLCFIVYAGASAWAATLREVERAVSAPLHLLQVLSRVAPFGGILAFAAAGYGAFAAFVTLFFQQQGWAWAGLPLACYGVSFMLVRILFGRLVNRYSVFRIGLLSMTLELAALAMLSTARGPLMGLVAACMMGAGFSLLFPALCLRTLQAVGSRDRASAISLFTAFLELSVGLSPPLAGLVIAGYGFRAAFWSAFAVVVLGAVILAFLHRREGHSQRALSAS